MTFQFHSSLSCLIGKMVNLIAAMMPLIHGVAKKAGVVPHTVEIEPSTVINIWVPRETLKATTTPSPAAAASQAKTTKTAVVLVHGFVGDGIITWLPQVPSLAKKYAVYVPDLLFFGGSATDKADRSPAFQAECLAKCLRKVGVERCVVVGFSYGGMVAFKMAEMYPELVEAMVISGAVTALTESVNKAMLEELRHSSLTEFLLPKSVKECKALLRVGMHKKLWIPSGLYKDFFEAMYKNTKERGELLQGLVVRSEEISMPNFSQRIHLLWGEEDKLFKKEIGQKMKEELGDKTSYQGIKKAGHLVHLERPLVYNRFLKQFLVSLRAEESRKV